MMDIVVPNNQYRQCVGVEKIKKLLERCQRITALDSTRVAGSRAQAFVSNPQNVEMLPRDLHKGLSRFSRT